MVEEVRQKGLGVSTYVIFESCYERLTYSLITLRRQEYKGISHELGYSKIGSTFKVY